MSDENSSAKQTYKIPDSLDKTVLDAEIPLNFSGSATASKPISLRNILFWLISIMTCMFCIMRTFVSAGGLFLDLLFAILWLVITAVLLSSDGTGAPNYTMFMYGFDYIPKNRRNIIVRSDSHASVFCHLSGIWQIGADALSDDTEAGSTYDPGLILFDDGSVGYIYSVVGTASVLLFEADKDAIINQADVFQRKQGTGYEQIYITVKQAQNVENQVGYIEDRLNNLYNQFDGDIDPDLVKLCDGEFNLLVNKVGKLQRSIHQYLILKATNYETLHRAHVTLNAEADFDQFVFRECTQLHETKDDPKISEVLATIFRGKE